MTLSLKKGSDLNKISKEVLYYQTMKHETCIFDNFNKFDAIERTKDYVRVRILKLNTISLIKLKCPYGFRTKSVRTP